jgi:rod shape-determining protein MreD
MIRRILLLFSAAIVGFFINATLIHSLAPAAIAPDFITVLVVCLALRFRHAGGVFGAFLLGVLADFASAQFVGPNAAGSIVAFCFVLFLSNKIYIERTPSIMLVAFLAACAKSITYVLMLAAYASVNVMSAHVVGVILLEALFTGLIAPILFRLVNFAPGRSRQRGQYGTGSLYWSTR